MTKEEKIKEAWESIGYSLNDISRFKSETFNETGFVNFSVEFKYLKKEIYHPENFDFISIRFARPKSLKGIENNNGWSLMSPDFLENDKLYFLCDNNIPIHGIFTYHKLTETFLGNFQDVNEKIPTHYQEIRLPKPPIY
ncbi:hypothetical protein J2X97_000355 [Epilithonimonas hungarica]|uniref:hypothetical protein n=1 Tax=Epilithonimonas hungarica TaxID=454006 RepID=UPI00277E1722|nr:hypothetical protein [Epilithonimonas hungarica]MDP9954718.1 hypothetical protein [Epilithonimonas hungarica]